MGVIDARWKLLGQTGALNQVRVFNGIPIRREPLGKSSPGSESSPEVVIHSRHLSTSLTLWQLIKSPDACTPKVKEKNCAALLSISCLCHCFFTVDVCVFPRVRCICLHQTTFSLYIFFITYWGRKEKKERTKVKKSPFTLSAQSSAQIAHLFLSSSFQEWLRKWFYYIVTFSLNSPLWSSGIK